MTRLLLVPLLLGTLLVAWLPTQASRITSILSQTPVLVEERKKQPEQHEYFIWSDFADGSLKNVQMLQEARGQTVLKIELVYTSYRLSDNFDQVALNRVRLNNLSRLAPEWFSRPMIDWEVVAQTAAASPEQGKGFFHGFVVTCRKPATAADTEREIALLDQVAQQLKNAPNGNKPPPGRERRDPTVFSRTNAQPTNTPLTPAEKDELRKMGKFTMVQRWDDRVGYKHDTIWHAGPRKPQPPANAAKLDSMVLGILSRNKTWDNMLVVVDVTNSMGPYTAQVLQWINADVTDQRTRHYTFFTDGDGRNSNTKKPGKTGGIHHQDDMRMQPVLETMKTAMRACKRNDAPENDIEGILEGLKACPDCKRVVLIADNDSDMRDYSLSGYISVPVHVIACGARRAIHPDYIELARKTGGSVHTMEHDVTGLSELTEGQTIEILGLTYEVRNGRLRVTDWD